MSLVDELKKAGLLPEDTTLDDTRAAETLAARLSELAELRQKTNQSQQQQQAAAPAPPPASSDVNENLEAAKQLQRSGIIKKNEKGVYEATTPEFASYATALNLHETKRRAKLEEVTDVLVSDPKKFVSEVLGDALKEFVEQQAKQVTSSLEKRLEDIDRKVVKQPSAAERWYAEKQQELEKEESPLRQAYEEVFTSLVQQAMDDGTMPAEGTPEYDKIIDQIHETAAAKAELRLLKGDDNTKKPSGEGGGSVEPSTPPDTQPTSPVDTQRTPNNNGSRVPDSRGDTARSGGLNDTADDIGDINVPVRGGKVDWDALTQQTLQELQKAE